MGYIFVQSYLTANGRVWEMGISRGVVYCRWQGSTDWKVTDQDYLGQRWMLRPSREWVVVPKLRSDSIAYAFYHLATVLLPFWENYVHSQFNRSTRKQWSYDGVTALGDLGNRVYALVVKIAQLLRERLGSERLWLLDTLNFESQGDVLEGIMGLEFHTPGAYDPDSTVSTASIAVYDMWHDPTYCNLWVMCDLAKGMYDSLGLNAVKDQIDHKRFVANKAVMIDIRLTIVFVIGHRCAFCVYKFLQEAI